MISNIPIFRAKVKFKNEYIVGYYLLGVYSDHLIHPVDVLPEYISDGYSGGMHFNTFEEIDPTTLAIHFPDMLDSQGNKVFASLQEDGKGGDIVSLGTITKTAIWCKKTQAIMLNSKSNGLSVLSLYKEDIEVIGIQE